MPLWLPTMVQWVRETKPWSSLLMAPPLPMLVFSANVQLTAVMLERFWMAPPVAALFWEKVQESSVRVPLFRMAPPNQPFVTPVQPELTEALPIKDLKYWLRVDTGVTPLMACAARGDVEAAAVLIRNGAKPGVCTKKHKRYPINFAATQGYLFLMRVLLGRSPDEEPALLVTVDLSQQKAWITKKGEIIDSTRVSTGRSGHETPAGRYVVTDKHKHHTSTIYKVDMPWFMRLNCGAIGLHSGHVTGRPASHGCVRLPFNKARDFFSKVSVGDEVQIVR